MTETYSGGNGYQKSVVALVRYLLMMPILITCSNCVKDHMLSAESGRFSGVQLSLG